MFIIAWFVFFLPFVNFFFAKWKKIRNFANDFEKRKSGPIAQSVRATDS